MATLTKSCNALASLDSNGRVVVASRAKEDVRNAVVAFLDMASTATGKSTFYNTKEEQQTAIDKIHDAVFAVNRGLYAALLTLPGLTDYSSQRGLTRLLDDKTGQDESSMITDEQERKVISFLSKRLPAQRLLKMIGMLREGKVNNKRTRTFILRSILGAENLEWWAVKYRQKMATALTHAWGQKVATFVRVTLSKPESRRNTDEKNSLRKLIDKYSEQDMTDATVRKTVYEVICFVLGGEVRAPYKSDLIRSFMEAHQDLSAGKKLPKEVLEGIRSVYHKYIPSSQILELTKETMTEGEKMTVQRAAREAGVEIKFDPTKQDMVKLYVYALEMGMNQEIRSALNKKAKQVAATIPFSYRNIGVVVDNSRSMTGSKEQKNRPIAIALALRDVLSASATEDAVVVATNGDFDSLGMVVPSGETSLADSLLEALDNNPEAVFLITDGYENAPAGRTAEVIERLRKMGIDTPIYQLTPTMAAEAVGKEVGAVRRLSNDAALMSVSKPEGIGVSMIRAALAADIENGIRGLLNKTIPMLESQAA